jgi:hypothetical protein
MPSRWHTSGPLSNSTSATAVDSTAMTAPLPVPDGPIRYLYTESSQLLLRRRGLLEIAPSPGQFQRQHPRQRIVALVGGVGSCVFRVHLSNPLSVSYCFTRTTKKPGKSGLKSTWCFILCFTVSFLIVFSLDVAVVFASAWNLPLADLLQAVAGVLPERVTLQLQVMNAHGLCRCSHG